MSRIIAGRYRIDRKVGRGGSAAVFAARDTWLDQPVAVKLLLASDRSYARLLAHEFALLFPIRHPHLPLVHDLGRLPPTPVFDEAPPAAPYLVEELCPGSPAPRWARDRSPEQIAAVGAQVAAALAALHARDIQHGDIKPDNILVAGQERPHAKLIDFNLATKGTSTAVSGTLRYMAPEALGGNRSLASDIYSLGATLAELVTGSPPDQHHGAQLEAPHLNDAVAAMTHPNSGRRADAVTAFDLLAAAAGDLTRDVGALRNAAQASTGFWGQEATVRAIDDALEGRGTRVLRIGGGPGSGKTTALAQVIERSALAGHTVTGAIRPARSGGLEEVERALVELGCEPCSRLPGTSDDPTTATWQRFTLLAEQLATVTDDAPLSLVFDNVPPDSPLDRFAGFLERLGERGPRLLWAHSGRCASGAVTLSPLDATALAAAVRVARPLRPLDAKTAEALHAASGGNPQAAVTLLHSLPGDLLLGAARDGTLARGGTLHALVAQRLERASPETRALVHSVAALAPPVPLSLVRALPDGKRFSDSVVDEAIDSGLLLRSGWDAGPVLTVAGEAVAHALRDNASHELVRVVAETLARADADGGDRAAELGHLWLRLGRPDLAHGPLLEGARRAAAHLRLGDALADYDALLGCGPDSEIEASARLESARLLVALGKAPEAVERLHGVTHPEARLVRADALLAAGRYSEASSALTGTGPAGEDRTAVEAALARARLHAGDHRNAQALAEEALQNRSNHPRRAELQTVIGLCAFYRGDLETAVTALEEAGQLAADRDDSALADSTRANLALALHKSGDMTGAERAYSESLAAARAQRDLPRQQRRLTNLAALRQELGAWEAALAGYQEAFDLARLVDGRREMVHVAINWGNLLCFLGDGAAARERLMPALLAAKELDMKTERAYLDLVDAEVALTLGSSSAAEAAVERADAVFVAGDNQAGRAEAEALRAEVALHRRDTAATREHAGAAVELAAAAGRDRIEAQALVWRALADLEEPSASPDAALGAALRASEIAERRGDADLGWLAHAAAGRLHARIGRSRESNHHNQRAHQLAEIARSRLSSRYERSYGSVWYRRELWAAVCLPHESEPTHPQRDLDRLLAINRELAQDHDPDRLLERIIDAAIALSGAERGFIVLAEDGAIGRLLIRAARNIDQESVDGTDLSVSRSIARQAMHSGMPVTSVNAVDDERFAETLSVHQMKLRSVLCLPLRAPRGVLGSLYLDNRYRVNAFSDADVALLSAFGDQAAIALANARIVSQLDMRSRELERSRAQIEELNQRLEQELAAQSRSLELARSHAGERSDITGRHGMVGRSAAMREVYRIIDRVADKEATVTILGESGTGKELVARAIHAASTRADGPFVSVNCGAIPGELLESELFGHERGAFTGAVRCKPGLFEVARRGTILLDEIGDMPLAMQVKLLRVLQQKEFRRVGGTENLATDARVLSASNRDLEAMVRSGDFREDLWYRLNVVGVHLPPLRERREDLPLLIDHLLARHGGECPPRVRRDALAAMLDYRWPGNVRELDNEIQRAVALAENQIAAADLSTRLQVRPKPSLADGGNESLRSALERFERDTIQAVLAAHHGKVAQAARQLGLTRAGLYKKINKYGLHGERG